MASLMRRLLSIKKIAICNVPMMQSSRAKGHWNEDYQPGPYPKTEAERVAAAKKYGMLREDYEPYPDDGMGWGDYPNLPIVSPSVRDPLGDYDYKQFQRDFGEPIQVDADIYNNTRMTYEEVDQLTYSQALASFLGVVTFLIVMCYLTREWKLEQQKPMQKPHTGVVHYSFEKP